MDTAQFVTYPVFTWAIGLLATLMFGLFGFMWHNLGKKIDQINKSLKADAKIAKDDSKDDENRILNSIRELKETLERDINNHKTDIQNLYNKADIEKENQAKKWEVHAVDNSKHKTEVANMIKESAEAIKEHAKNSREMLKQSIELMIDNKINNCLLTQGQTQTLKRN